jgi:hypothetical protein
MSLRSGTIDFTFPRDWDAEILETSPLIAPPRHFFYPEKVDEVELGALQISLRAKHSATDAMATFALGFADPSLPHGLWSCPNPRDLCAVAGGYAYIVDTQRPEEWRQIPYRPVSSVHVAADAGLLLFAGFHALWALGANGKEWETARLSWEGLTIQSIHGPHLEGLGWDMATDTEVPFTVDLKTGCHTGGSAPTP